MGDAVGSGMGTADHDDEHRSRPSLSQALAEFRAITAAFRAGGGDDALDDRLALLENRLITGGIVSPDDLRAKAGYLADCAAVDPALIPAAAVATLVNGIDVLFPTFST